MMLVPMPTGKSLEVAVEAVKEFVGKIIGPTLEEVGLTFGDHIRSFRLKRQIRLLLTAQARLEKAGITPQTVPLKTFMPLLEGASLEDDEQLEEKWAGLLASAASGDHGPGVIPSFPIMLKQLTPLDARLLDYLAEGPRVHNDDTYVERGVLSSRLGAEPDDLDIVADNLVGLGLVGVEPAAGVYGGVLDVSDQQSLRISSLGSRFVEACKGPDEGG